MRYVPLLLPYVPLLLPRRLLKQRATWAHRMTMVSLKWSAATACFAKLFRLCFDLIALSAFNGKTLGHFTFPERTHAPDDTAYLCRLTFRRLRNRRSKT